MDIKLITQLVPLFFLGAMTFFGITFFYFINSINAYYKKHAKLIKGKIIAFKEESKTYRSNRRTTRTTTICPVIEYYQDGQRKLFLGTNQSFLKNKSIIDIKDFETSDEYIKSAAKFNKKVSNTHFYGIVLTTIFGCGLYYLIKHVCHTKLHSRDKVLFTNFLNDFNNYHHLWIYHKS